MHKVELQALMPSEFGHCTDVFKMKWRTSRRSGFKTPEVGLGPLGLGGQPHYGAYECTQWKNNNGGEAESKEVREEEAAKKQWNDRKGWRVSDTTHQNLGKHLRKCVCTGTDIRSQLRACQPTVTFSFRSPFNASHVNTEVKPKSMKKLKSVADYVNRFEKVDTLGGFGGGNVSKRKQSRTGGNI